ncbi:hypothetical protein B0H14DRAFT_2603398 [Mycena olivaceomarginata]|nr:hypothetical protein B0H14DRAFT_2603397 [Mycena olivaceomarginata]KAJ7815514.1 hypothetical protein B0H14DRAFT_2603398 [Mycena olivaceomarginata]
MPALTSLLEAADNMDPLLESSPPPATPDVLPAHRGSSVPPQDSPDDVDIRAEHPTSDDILWTPQTEKKILHQRVEAQCQQSHVSNCTEWSRRGRRLSGGRDRQPSWRRRRTEYGVFK